MAVSEKTPPARWRAPVAAILVVLGLVLAPLGVVASSARATLADTDRFVAAFAPLAEDERVQEAITTAVAQQIDEVADVPGIVDRIVDGLVEGGLPSPAATGLRLLGQPLVAGAQSATRSFVQRLVESDGFAQVWRETLRISHGQLIAALEGRPDALIGADAGTLSLELAPVIGAVRDRLVAGESGWARLIPERVDLRVPIAEIDGLEQVGPLYRMLMATGAWLPILALVLVGAGIAAAPRRRSWAARAGIALAVLMAVLGILIAVGRAALHSTGVDPGLLDAVYDAATTRLSAVVLGVGLLGALAAALVVLVRVLGDRERTVTGEKP